MAELGHGWGRPPLPPAHWQPPQRVSLWEPPPRRDPAADPPPAPQLRPPRPPWYRRAWFIGLVIVVVFGTAGAVLGAQVPP